MTNADSSKESPPVSPSDSQQGGGIGFWALVLWRLVILGMGVSVAWLAGLAVAQLYPATSSDPPLQEVLLRQVYRTQQRVKRLSQAWQGPSSLSPVLDALPPGTGPLPPEQAPSLGSNSSQADIAALEAELDAVRDRISTLETELGASSPATASLESRLERLAKVAENLSAAPTTPTATEPAATEPAATEPAATEPAATEPAAAPPTTTPPSDPLFTVNTLMVTLPSDALFTPDDPLLRPTAGRILDTLVSDLASYPGATILISGHTDRQLEPDESLTTSFQQALAVQRYLETLMGDTAYHWVAIGHGPYRPIVSSEEMANQPRNRRIEIAIDLRSSISESESSTP